ncbi:transposable element Tcb1 transposase [Trichonephila clavipes]|nr:transposable element Tcb1 transposase [Trichonephila clavipes]
MCRRKHRSASDQVSEFDRGRIVAYRDCGLSFRKIGSRVGRNQTTLKRICDRWMQEVTDLSVTSRTVAQHIESLNRSFSVCAYHSTPFTAELSVRKTSITWSTLDAEPQTSAPQWCGERKMWATEWNEVVFTDESRICLQHHDGQIRVWRHCGERMLNSYVMHRHTGPAPGIMVWGGIGYRSHAPLVRITGNLKSQRYISEVLEPFILPYHQGLATAIFRLDNT